MFLRVIRWPAHGAKETANSVKLYNITSLKCVSKKGVDNILSLWGFTSEGMFFS
jgi:hypothetical protein